MSVDKQTRAVWSKTTPPQAVTMQMDKPLIALITLITRKAQNLRHRLTSYRAANPDRLPRRMLSLLCQVERIAWGIREDDWSLVSGHFTLSAA